MSFSNCDKRLSTILWPEFSTAASVFIQFLMNKVIIMKLLIIFVIFPTIVLARSSIPRSDEVVPKRNIPGSIFTIVAPYKIRRDKPYNIHVRGFDLKDHIQLAVKIRGTSTSGTPLSIKKYVALSKENSKASIKIDTSVISKGNYKLYVEGENFLEERTLVYVEKKYTFIAQFNKPIYQPGDLLKFRIYSIDSETRSINPTQPNILKILDPKGNVIKVFENISFKNGKYENELQLGDKASFGAWNFEFKSEDDFTSKQFHVAEYRLPLIIAKLSVQEEIPFGYGKFPISVEASYTSGGGANGVATVDIKSKGSTIFSKIVSVVDGKAIFDVDIENDLKIKAGEADVNLNIKLEYDDLLTGIKASDSKSCQIIPYIYKIFAESSGYVPRVSFNYTIKVKKFDGSPAPEGFEVKVTNDDAKHSSEKMLTLDENGEVSSSDSSEYRNVITIKVTAKNARPYTIRGIGSEPRAPTAIIGVRISREKIRLNKPVKLNFIVGDRVPYLMIHIVSKGVLLESAKLWFGSRQINGVKSATYTFTPTFKYIPNAYFTAYYILEGVIKTYSFRLQLDKDLPNYLKITPVKDTVAPKSNITFEIESYVESTVSLVAVDQRLLLLKKDNDLLKNQVYRNLQLYDSQKITFNWINVAQYEETFGKHGLYILTNIPRPKKLYASSTGSGESFDVIDKDIVKADIKTRVDFRESFLWRGVDINNYLYNDAEGDEYYYGIESISEKVPESITTYLIYGVSMSKYDGLGLSDNIPSVSVFLPFFLSVELPYSVKRNEVLIQDIFLFNYLKDSQYVEIRITKDSKYEAVHLGEYGWNDHSSYYYKTYQTKIGQNIKIQFALRPTELGYITFEVKAKGTLAGDGLKKQLRVIPGGVPRSITKSVYIAFDKSSSDKVVTSLRCNLPDSAYQNTAEISATVVGDIFGKTLNNLDKLIHLPSGCGEQTMLSLVPDIAIYEYLKAANKLTPALKTTLEAYVTSGYQNQLRYQKNDGSFSAFGEQDPSGSTWLTAYVGQFFYFAKNIITIDSNVINKAGEFVVKQQNTADGSFKESGSVIHSDMQGGSGNGIALTAYCAIFLTHILTDYPTYETARDKAIKYLEDNLITVASTYELGIVGYALQLYRSSKATDVFDKFDAKKTDNGESIYWALSKSTNNIGINSLDVEVTSYGLLTYLERDIDAAKSVKIVKYLISKSNNFGGYGSSQDTIMALYALSRFAESFSSNGRIDISLEPNVGSAIITKVDLTNAFIVQSFELNPRARKLKVSTSSDDSGIAIVSLICNFYEDPMKTVPKFEITYRYSLKCKSRIIFETCVKYIPSGKSNMAILTITLPSGFVYNQAHMIENPHISQTEVTNQGTTVIFYINSITNKKTCITVNAYRTKFVADLKDGSIVVTDYYNTALDGMISLADADSNEECYYSH